jgi:hypothetical protein
VQLRDGLLLQVGDIHEGSSNGAARGRRRVGACPR